ncbi:type I restriction endonuclease subunit R [Vandammella animalimorsus]|uniref:Type I restriction endonuclease subunit R n=1 Tax=Vandammella animalimorsus TaxID=2029117 RepID=A0A2A2ATV9_9BURK|nr:type I restriction endonuclease [Vandammella animalimorsus]PAT41193.1 type I restriction endonuclease subunit R [Vandammella animalimorsus]
MDAFTERMSKHAEHVKAVAAHCNSEETTKQALILPVLDILGFSPFDPTKVKAEYGADFPGVKSSERVDYALFCHGVPVMFIEAKAHSEKLNNHCPQLSRYFNATPEVTIAAITNGEEWRFFTDLNNKNVMDSTPFLTVDFGDMDITFLQRLRRFRHDEFQPEALRTLAEETVYLNAFTEVISSSLREPDVEFVRYVAGRADIQRQFNARFLESIAPLVKQAVERAVSNMVVSGLSMKAPAAAPAEVLAAEPEPAIDPMADIVDADNPRIVTTYAERRLLEVALEILGAQADITAKDTESYYSLLYQGKVNRWLLRYQADKRQPCIFVCVPLTEHRKKEIERAGLQIGTGDSILLNQPEHLARIAGIVFDALEYCRDDNNFKRARGDSA